MEIALVRAPLEVPERGEQARPRDEVAVPLEEYRRLARVEIFDVPASARDGVFPSVAAEDGRGDAEVGRARERGQDRRRRRR
eukprot:31034-Pelagococcus_subviridis.AAC.7